MPGRQGRSLSLQCRGALGSVQHIVRRKENTDGARDRETRPGRNQGVQGSGEAFVVVASRGSPEKFG